MRNTIKMVGLVFVLALAACGEGGGGGGGGGAGAFVGTWRPTAGAIKKVCPGAAPKMEPLAADVAWSTGTSSDLTSISPISPCRLKANVADMAAIGVPDDNCRYAERDGTSILTLNHYTFVIAPDGRSAEEIGLGKITLLQAGLATVCEFETTGTYVKIAN